MLGEGFAAEAEGGGGEVVEAVVEGEPFAAFALGYGSGGVGAGEDVHYEVAGVGEEADEEFGQLGREAGGMAFDSEGFAASEVAAVGLGVGDLEKIGRDGTAVVCGEAFADVVAGGALFRGVESFGVFEELFHAVAVFGEDFGDVGFWPAGFAKPPDSVHGVFGAEFPLVHPFDGAGEFGGVVPVEVFGEMETEDIAKMDGDAEIVEAAGGDSSLVSTAKVEDEAAVVA